MWSDVALAASSSGPGTSAPAAAEDKARAQQKSEIVPRTIVVDFVHAHVLVKQRDDKGHRRDEAVPQTAPKSRHRL